MPARNATFWLKKYRICSPNRYVRLIFKIDGPIWTDLPVIGCGGMTATPWGNSDELRDKRLAPGPSVSREDVELNHRERLFGATVAVSAEKGYAETTVSDILMPPTITELAGPRPGMHGSATPNTEITLFVSPDGFTESATTDAGGAWSHTFSTPLPAGSRSAYAVASTQGGLVSSASSTVTFNVTCAVADYDCSGRVDIVDFSVLMYYWGTNDPTADTNGDGIIDLTDFSIMMYYWNG